MPTTARAGRAHVPRRRPVVLMYHGFSVGRRPRDPYHLFVREDALRQQLDHLRRTGWEALDLDGYLAAADGRRSARGTYLVTIDDGFHSVADIGVPVLAELGIPSVLFVPAGRLGKPNGWLQDEPDELILDADRLRSLTTMGVEIGVHGWEHASMAGMDEAALRTATRQARGALADAVGTLPRAFAYPYGDYDAAATAAVAAAGFDVAFSVYSDSGRYAVSRVDVKPDDTLRAFRVKLVPHYRALWRAAGRLGPLRRRLRLVAQRR